MISTWPSDLTMTRHEQLVPGCRLLGLDQDLGCDVGDLQTGADPTSLTEVVVDTHHLCDRPHSARRVDVGALGVVSRHQLDQPGDPGLLHELAKLLQIAEQGWVLHELVWVHNRRVFQALV